MRVWVLNCSGLVEISLCAKDHPKKARPAVDFFLPESTKREISSPPAVNRGNKTALQGGALCTCARSMWHNVKKHFEVCTTHMEGWPSSALPCQLSTDGHRSPQKNKTRKCRSSPPPALPYSLSVSTQVVGPQATYTQYGLQGTS